METPSPTPTPSRAPALFFDTETNGFPRNLPDNDPKQVKLVQLAYIFTDAEGVERASGSMIVRPDGWTIPSRVAEVHGITTELAQANGIPLKTVIAIFSHYISIADVIVAHNATFDLKVIKTCFGLLGHDEPERFKRDKQIICTKNSSLNVVKCPPTAKMLNAGRRGFKAPQLGEAFKHFTGETLEGAHDALVDTRACKVIYENLWTDHRSQLCG